MEQTRPFLLRKFSISLIVNSIRTTIWKMADASPLPKKSLYTQGLKKDLRPTSLTACVSKVAKGSIVEDYVKPAVLNVIGHSKNEEITNSSTTMARLCCSSLLPCPSAILKKRAIASREKCDSHYTARNKIQQRNRDIGHKTHGGAP